MELVVGINGNVSVIISDLDGSVGGKGNRISGGGAGFESHAVLDAFHKRLRGSRDTFSGAVPVVVLAVIAFSCAELTIELQDFSFDVAQVVDCVVEARLRYSFLDRAKLRRLKGEQLGIAKVVPHRVLGLHWKERVVGPRRAVPLPTGLHENLRLSLVSVCGGSLVNYIRQELRVFWRQVARRLLEIFRSKDVAGADVVLVQNANAACTSTTTPTVVSDLVLDSRYGIALIDATKPVALVNLNIPVEDVRSTAEGVADILHCSAVTAGSW